MDREARHRFLCWSISFGLFCLVSSLQAQTLFFADFQDETAGQIPSILAVDPTSCGPTCGDNGTTLLVRTTDPVNDPFGIPGNKSMKLEDQNGAFGGYRAVFNWAGDGNSSFADVTIEMDMVITAPQPEWSITHLWIGDTLGDPPQWFANGVVTQIFPALNVGGINSVGQVGGYYSQGAAGGGGSVITQDVPFHFKLVFDSDNATYNAFIDNVQLGWDFLDGNGTVFDMPVAFPGPNPPALTTINNLTFTTEGLGVAESGPVYVDNLKVSIGAPPIPGDFNGDGVVDGLDLAGVDGWEERFGVDLTGSDLLVWHRNLGAGAAVAGGVLPAPEPASLSLLLSSLAGVAAGRRVRGRRSS